MEEGWAVEPITRALGMKQKSVKRKMKRLKNAPKEAVKRGRPEVIDQEARWKLRKCYVEHFCEWGSRVLACWALRQGLGNWAPDTIAKVIVGLKKMRG